MTTKSARKAKPSKKKVELNGQVPSTGVDVLTLAEAASFLRVPEEGLRADAANGRVPGRLIAGEWRFSQAGLLGWLADFEQTPTQVKVTGNDLLEHIRKTGVPWNITSEREAEAFIAATNAISE